MAQVQRDGLPDLARHILGIHDGLQQRLGGRGAGRVVLRQQPKGHRDAGLGRRVLALVGQHALQQRDDRAVTQTAEPHDGTGPDGARQPRARGAQKQVAGGRVAQRAQRRGCRATCVLIDLGIQEHLAQRGERVG